MAGSLLSATIAFFAPEERAKDADRAAAASKAAAEGRAGIMGGLNEMYTTAMMVFPLLATKIIVSVGNAMYQGWVLASPSSLSRSIAFRALS